MRLEALRRRLPLFEKSAFDLRNGGRIVDEHLFGGDFDFGADLADADAAFVWDGAVVEDLEAHQPSIRHVSKRLWQAIDTFADIATPEVARAGSRRQS